MGNCNYRKSGSFGRLECPPLEVVDCGVVGRGAVCHAFVGPAV